MNAKRLFLTSMILMLAQSAHAQERDRGYPPRFPNAEVKVYKKVGDVALRMFLFKPKNHSPTESRPALVFFFGGGFTGGSPAQFHQHCRYFASRGMLAVTADYRVKNRHATVPADSIQDGKDAMRWIRANSKKLGIDPKRIVAAGGSAGGLIAACVGVIDDLDSGESENPISYAPNAMVLFNPAIMGTKPVERTNPDGSPSFAKEIMPYFHIRKGLPPSIMFYGEQDKFTVGAREFQEVARGMGNRCELQTWKGVGHGFFNLGRNDNKEFVATLQAADKFLVSLGYLQGEPSVDSFAKTMTAEVAKSDAKSKAQKRQEARRKAKERDIARLLKDFDKNKDGELEESEIPDALQKRLLRLDANEDGKLSKAELLKLRARLGQRTGEIITGAARGERYDDTLEVGDAAPDFTLSDLAGKRDVTLSSFQGKRPVVLIFGSYT